MIASVFSLITIAPPAPSAVFWVKLHSLISTLVPVVDMVPILIAPAEAGLLVDDEPPKLGPTALLPIKVLPAMLKSPTNSFTFIAPPCHASFSPK